MTVGELTHAHIGVGVSLGVESSTVQPWGETVTQTHTITGEVVRVQHNAGETLLVLSSWSGTLDPAHPITIETVTPTETGA